MPLFRVGRLCYARRMDLREKKIFCQVVAQLLIIDSELTDTEHKFLYDLMEAQGLGKADQEEVIAGVNLDTSVEARVAGLSAAHRDKLAEALRLAAEADGVVTAVEEDIIALVTGAA
jgi:hypothetical protein